MAQLHSDYLQRLLRLQGRRKNDASALHYIMQDHQQQKQSFLKEASYDHVRRKVQYAFVVGENVILLQLW